MVAQGCGVTLGDPGVDLWDNDDEFYYDLISFPNGDRTYVRLRSLVGLIPLLAVETIDPELLDALRREREGSATFTLVTRETVRLPFSLLGFSAAFRDLDAEAVSP